MGKKTTNAPLKLAENGHKPKEAMSTEVNPFKNSEGKFVARLVVDAINRSERFVFDCGQRRFFRFVTPIWKPTTEIEVLHFINKFLGHEPDPYVCNRVFEKLKITNVGETSFDRAALKIAFKNGVLDVGKAVEEEERSEMQMALSRHFTPFAEMSEDAIASLWLSGTINAKFDLLARMDNFTAYLASTFNGVEDVIPVVREMLGYCLTNDYSIHCWFLLRGSGGNGKTVLLNVIKRLLGCLAIHINFANFGRFTAANLLNKLVCISEEMPRRPLDWDLLKDLTGGGYTNAELKFGGFFNFRATAKILASANEGQVIPDSSDASWQRIVSIPFPNSFRNTAGQILRYESLLEPELDGIALWAIGGLLSLLRRKRFDLPKNCSEMVEKSRIENDSVRAFVNDRCVIDARCASYSDSLYMVYKAYCLSAGVGAVTQKRFQERILKFGVTCEREPSTKKPRRHYFEGIGFCPELAAVDKVPTHAKIRQPKRWAHLSSHCNFPIELIDDKKHCAQCDFQCSKTICSPAEAEKKRKSRQCDEQV